MIERHHGILQCSLRIRGNLVGTTHERPDHEERRVGFVHLFKPDPILALSTGSGGHSLKGLTGLTSEGSFGSSAEGIGLSCPFAQEKLSRRHSPLTITAKLIMTCWLFICSLTRVVSSITDRMGIGASRPDRAASVLNILPVSKSHRTGYLPEARDLAARTPFPRND